ncbi:hypothetical protein ACVW0J_000108 [Bradyrhizobium sp. i1.7.7]
MPISGSMIDRSGSAGGARVDMLGQAAPSNWSPGAYFCLNFGLLADIKGSLSALVRSAGTCLDQPLEFDLHRTFRKNVEIAMEHDDIMPAEKR